MKPAPFVYHAPRSVAEVVDVLARVGHVGKVLAGGQSLVPLLTMRLASPEHIIDIGGVPGLDRIEIDERWVRVGALVRHRMLERHPEADAALPLLHQAVRHVAHPAIRARGTAVGSIVHADPAAELPAVFALTGGTVEAVSARGMREISASDLVLGPLETSLDPDELAVAVRFGRFAPGTRTAFVESARRSGDYALAGVAVAVEVGDDAAIRSARASFVSVTATPGVLDLTPVLLGMPSGAAIPDAADALVRDHVHPDGDIHASADYRRALVVELTRRALGATLAPGGAASGAGTAGRAEEVA